MDYFKSEADKYVFYLTKMDGKSRHDILGITDLHYEDKELATDWYLNILGKIKGHKEFESAKNKLVDIYACITDGL